MTVWQALPEQESKNLGVHNVDDTHPAYFILRRKALGTDYVEAPVFQTRSALLSHRRERWLANRIARHEPLS